MPYTDRNNGDRDPVNSGPLGGLVQTLAATGSTQTDAAQITGELVKVTGADATKGVKLPACTDTQRLTTSITVWNSAAAVLKVYGATGGVINGGSANAATSCAANTVMVFRLFAADTWIASEAPQA